MRSVYAMYYLVAYTVLGSALMALAMALSYTFTGITSSPHGVESVASVRHWCSGPYEEMHLGIPSEWDPMICSPRIHVLAGISLSRMLRDPCQYTTMPLATT